LLFADFCPEYVRAHSRPATRAVHCAGTLLGCGLFAAALGMSYALAWTSHFLLEHNRPATFEHPLWS